MAGNRSPALLLMGWLVGCSLMNLDELDARPCQSHADCARAQRSAGLDPTLCGHCIDGLCDYQHRSETCNGEDDDCDGLIDEGVSPPSLLVTEGRLPQQPIAFATAPTRPMTTYVALGGTSPKGFTIAEDGVVSGPSDLRYDSIAVDTTYACPSTLPEAPFVACNVKELALTVDTARLLYATINTYNCKQGLLRLGLAHRDSQPFTVWLGKPEEAGPLGPDDLGFGVDVDREQCGGASLRSGSVLGARSPAVASVDLGPGGLGALVAWLATSAEREPLKCDATATFPVQALGVLVPLSLDGWLTGTDGGKPQLLGETTSLAPPAVLALSSRRGSASYLVGFANEQGGTRGVRLVEVISRNRTLETEDFAFIPDAFADRVVLSADDLDSEPPRIGVAWTAPCEAVPSLRFTTISRPPRDVPARVLTLRANKLPQQLQLLHRRDGFSTTEPRGGWFMLWAEQQARTIKLARVTEQDDEPLNVVTLSSGNPGAALLIPVGASSLRHALLQTTDKREQIGVFGDWCRDRD